MLSVQADVKQMQAEQPVAVGMLSLHTCMQGSLTPSSSSAGSNSPFLLLGNHRL